MGKEEGSREHRKDQHAEEPVSIADFPEKRVRQEIVDWRAEGIARKSGAELQPAGAAHAAIPPLEEHVGAVLHEPFAHLDHLGFGDGQT